MPSKQKKIRQGNYSEESPAPRSNGKSPGGRTPKYRNSYPELVYRMCMIKNCTDKELSDILGITTETLYKWKKQFPEFSDAIKRGKEEPDFKVAKSIFSRAVGYSHPEEKVFLHEGTPVKVETTKHYPPDTAAAFIWLRNRQGWSNKSTIEHDGEVTQNVVQYYMPSNNRDIKGD